LNLSWHSAERGAPGFLGRSMRAGGGQTARVGEGAASHALCRRPTKHALSTLTCRELARPRWWARAAELQAFIRVRVSPGLGLGLPCSWTLSRPFLRQGLTPDSVAYRAAPRVRATARRHPTRLTESAPPQSVRWLRHARKGGKLNASPPSARRPSRQGLTLVHFSAQR
jgi:hypothetical protein